MIGVIAEAHDHEVVREFFELFKTPWEFYRNDRDYDVVLNADGSAYSGTAKLVLVYSGSARPGEECGRIESSGRNSYLLYRGRRLPIYGKLATFPGSQNNFLRIEGARQSASVKSESAGQTTIRVGYDLFSEVRSLLSTGQPSENASVPTLELHIALVRELIVQCGIELVEIPPVPEGHKFIVCLTHDVDHPLIRKHRWDHTILGFLYRATVISLLDCAKGRLPVRDLMQNWWAALKLPFVQVGILRDFWAEFAKRYLEIENSLPSTFFVIPFADHAGQIADGAAPAFRAAKYGAKDLAETIRELRTTGCEVSLHGLDAWIDSDRGRHEIEEIRNLTGSSEVGVRMHWLYFQKQSPAILEQAGAQYDSTVGYNQTVGYRAGTTQVYRPLNAQRLLELPMHAMDTALFYPNYLNLSPNQALDELGQLIDNAVEFGGCLTINWHDRSLAPERLWGDVYVEFIKRAKAKGALFLTAQNAVEWFRARRGARFTNAALKESVQASASGTLPPWKLCVHPSSGRSFDEASEALPSAYQARN